jgi:hypothetical protein
VLIIDPDLVDLHRFGRLADLGRDPLPVWSSSGSSWSGQRSGPELVVPAKLMRMAENGDSPSRIAPSQSHGQRHERALPNVKRRLSNQRRKGIRTQPGQFAVPPETTVSGMSVAYRKGSPGTDHATRTGTLTSASVGSSAPSTAVTRRRTRGA